MVIVFKHFAFIAGHIFLLSAVFGGRLRTAEKLVKSKRLPLRISQIMKVIRGVHSFFQE
jgi:hypothetical protein